MTAGTVPRAGDRLCPRRGGPKVAVKVRYWSPVLSVTHVSQPMRSVLSRERDLVLWGEAGLGGLLKVELLEAVEWRGESESSLSNWERGASLHPSMPPPEDRELSEGDVMV